MTKVACWLIAGVIAGCGTPDPDPDPGDQDGDPDAGEHFEPGPPGCGFDHAAFCDPFDAPAGAMTRAGELDPKKWSAARMCNIGGASSDGEAVGIGLASVPSCRSGLPGQVPPSGDTLICDPNATIKSNHLLTLVAAQNYGQNSYRIRQPFDFADRTGTIVFDADAVATGLLGWVSLEVTEDPTPAPSFTFQQNYENGAIPENAVEIQLTNSCNGANVGIGNVIVYRDFTQTAVLSNVGVCVPAAAGKLNHFEVRLSRTRLELYATPPSEDGLTFTAPVLLGAVDIDLPFTRGYVHLTAHNHATLKYSNDTVDAWAVRWDNVGFDGPAITSGWREYEVLDSLSHSQITGKTDVGWRLADAASGPAQTIAIPNVDVSGVVRAELALESWILQYVHEVPTGFALNYRLNGHAWKARTLSGSEVQMIADLPNAGTRSMMLDVDVADLSPGKNLLELTTSNVPTSYPPVALNIDLILHTQ